MVSTRSAGYLERTKELWEVLFFPKNFLPCLFLCCAEINQWSEWRYSSGLGAAKSMAWLIQSVCLVSLICFFDSWVTCCQSEQLSNWVLARLLICLHWASSCVGGVCWPHLVSQVRPDRYQISEPTKQLFYILPTDLLKVMLNKHTLSGSCLGPKSCGAQC